MKLPEAIREANESRDLHKWEQVLFFMRFRLGLTHAQSFKMLWTVYPSADMARFDEICRAVDDRESNPAALVDTQFV